MGHNVGDAAARSVQKGEKVKSSERTDLQIIEDIRRNFAAGLAVPPADQKFLLVRYDAEREEKHGLMSVKINAEMKIADLLKSNLEAMQGANQEIDALKAKIEEFRAVYEQENRSMAVVVHESDARNLDHIHFSNRPDLVEAIESIGTEEKS